MSFMSFYGIKCHFCHFMSYYIMLCNVMSYHIMSCDIILRGTADLWIYNLSYVSGYNLCIPSYNHCNPSHISAS